MESGLIGPQSNKSQKRREYEAKLRMPRPKRQFSDEEIKRMSGHDAYYVGYIQALDIFGIEKWADYWYKVLKQRLNS